MVVLTDNSNIVHKKILITNIAAFILYTICLPCTPIVRTMYVQLDSPTPQMPTTRINVRTEPLTKKRARKVFERLGLDLSTGINIPHSTGI